MTGVRILYPPVLTVLLICQFSVCVGKEASVPSDPHRYLNAVREFADSVLKYGRDVCSSVIS